MKDETLLEMLKRHEGLENYPYLCPAGSMTIGYGRNLEANGISDEEAMILLVHDLDNALKDVNRVFPNFHKMTKNRRNALTNMMFNLGYQRFLTFRKMISAILDSDWDRASEEAKHSKWFKQVRTRGAEIVKMLEAG